MASIAFVRTVSFSIYQKAKYKYFAAIGRAEFNVASRKDHYIVDHHTQLLIACVGFPIARKTQLTSYPLTAKRIT